MFEYYTCSAVYSTCGGTCFRACIYIELSVERNTNIVQHRRRILSTRPSLPQSITALAHLRACVLYVVDISEQCGYSLAQQAALFHSIKPLFSNKPVLIVCNKIDTVRMEDLAPESRALVEEMSKEATRISNGGLPVDAETERANPALVSMSTLTEVGVMEVKQAACDRLLNSRVELKLKVRCFFLPLNFCDFFLNFSLVF